MERWKRERVVLEEEDLVRTRRRILLIYGRYAFFRRYAGQSKNAQYVIQQCMFFVGLRTLKKYVNKGHDYTSSTYCLQHIRGLLQGRRGFVILTTHRDMHAFCNKNR